MLREIDRNLWVVEQPFKYFGLEVGTRMTLLQLSDGDLVAISPIKIAPEVVKQIDRSILLLQISIIIYLFRTLERSTPKHNYGRHRV
jgi:hypothetical protein